MRIDTRNPAAMAMVVCGVVLLLAAVVVHFVVQPPNVAAALSKLHQDEAKYASDASKNKTDTQTEFAQIQTRLWKDADDVIAPNALSSVTALAAKHGIKVTAFRPQKEITAGDLNILPFFVTVDGAFPAVFDFVKDLEESDQLQLIVNLVQLSSSDQASHNVTASIGISAYIDPNRHIVANDKGTLAPPTPKPTKTNAIHTDAHGVTAKGKA